MRLLGLAIGVIAVVAAFVIGRATSPSAASAMPLATTFEHFDCYTATWQGKFSATVNLKDQFQSYDTGVGAPQFFCNPVTKTVISGPKMKAPSPANHLACYAIQGPTINQTRPFANQFIASEVTVGTPSLLCVPTNKTG
jgi:hypothetical protein